MGVRGIEIPDMLWTERKGSMYLLEPELAADAVVGEDHSPLWLQKEGLNTSGCFNARFARYAMLMDL